MHLIIERKPLLQFIIEQNSHKKFKVQSIDGIEKNRFFVDLHIYIKNFVIKGWHFINTVSLCKTLSFTKTLLCVLYHKLIYRRNTTYEYMRKPNLPQKYATSQQNVPCFTANIIYVILKGREFARNIKHLYLQHGYFRLFSEMCTKLVSGPGMNYMNYSLVTLRVCATY